MSLPVFNNCPGTLAGGYKTYSRTCLNSMFLGRKVQHILQYDSPASDSAMYQLFTDNRKRLSISGVQEKFSVVLDGNHLRLAGDGERGEYILKPPPGVGKKPDEMPANEHLTMQIASQVYGIGTAENALIFFRNGIPAYITKRFDVMKDKNLLSGQTTKPAQEDFASLAGKTPQTHGEHYKYSGNYLELFQLLKAYSPAYKSESVKLLKIIVFNYLFSNGDAHLKNFSLQETPMGDFRLSPAYDLLNSRIHVDDSDFALEEGLLPGNLAEGKVSNQFAVIAAQAGIKVTIFQNLMELMLSKSEMVEKMIAASFLKPATKRNYLQDYQKRLKKLMKK